MMLTAARLSIPRVASSTATRSLSTFGGRRMMSIGTDIKSKERVEEERYIRQKEHELAEAKRNTGNKAKEEEIAKLQAEVDAANKTRFDATVKDAAAVLVQTGDKVSLQGIENLAKWKLDN
eukprot:103605_1